MKFYVCSDIHNHYTEFKKTNKIPMLIMEV